MCLLVCAEKGKAARKTAPAGTQKTRVRQMQEGDIRGQWTSWDKELVQVLPAEVQQQFPVVLNGGIAVHKPLFEDLMREVAAGRRSFEEWVRSHMQHQHHLFYEGLLKWLNYKLRCEQQLQHPMLRGSGAARQAAAPAAAAASGQGPAAQQQQQAPPAPAAATGARDQAQQQQAPAAAPQPPSAAAPGRGRPASRPAAGSKAGKAAKSQAAADKGGKLTQTSLRLFTIPKPAPPHHPWHQCATSWSNS